VEALNGPVGFLSVSKLGVPIKTTVSATVLVKELEGVLGEEGMAGILVFVNVTVRHSYHLITLYYLIAVVYC
jgi:hypothetical protein